MRCKIRIRFGRGSWQKLVTFFKNLDKTICVGTR